MNTKIRLSLLSLLAVSLSIGAAVADEILPVSKQNAPDYNQMSQGPLRVRLLPYCKSPAMMLPVYQDSDEYINSYISASKRLGVGDAWYCAFLSQKSTLKFLDTGSPTCLYVNHDAVRDGTVNKDKSFMQFQQELERDYPKQFYTFTVAEWENWAWRWWATDTWEKERESAFGITANDASKADRKQCFEKVQNAYKRWKKDLHGRVSSQNGYSFLSHLTAEVGGDFVGIETGENIPATQVKRAFVRGAARQFGLPWWEDVSAWYFDGSSQSGIDKLIVQPNGICVGPHTGHSPSMLERLWYTSWFSGTACFAIEGAKYLFDMPWDATTVPANVGLSDYGVRANKLFKMMNTQNIGVPYTPFAVIINKYHGRWTVWDKPWGQFDATVGDKMTERFFNQVFPGISGTAGIAGRCIDIEKDNSRKILGNEEYYLCPSPYGDTFDVLVNNADRSAWGAYPVILAVGDVPWTAEDINFLKRYVQKGGVLCLNEVNIKGWDRKYLGLAEKAFAPAGGAKAILKSKDGNPLLIHCEQGKGHIFVAAMKCEPGVDKEMSFPSPLLKSLAEKFVPFKVEGKVETLINRTSNGWAIMVVNNNGFTKLENEKPVIDLTKTEHVKISSATGKPKVTELYSGQKITPVKSAAGSGWTLSLDVKPGEIGLLKISM